MSAVYPCVDVVFHDLETLPDYHRRVWDNGLRPSWTQTFRFLDTTCTLMYTRANYPRGYPSVLALYCIQSSAARRSGRFKALMQYLSSVEVQGAIPVDRIEIMEVVNAHLAEHLRVLGWEQERSALHTSDALVGGTFWLPPADVRLRYELSTQVVA